MTLALWNKIALEDHSEAFQHLRRRRVEWAQLDVHHRVIPAVAHCVGFDAALIARIRVHTASHGWQAIHALRVGIARPCISIDLSIAAREGQT